MQTTSPMFDFLAGADVRRLDYQVRASFDKQIDPDVTFFTLDSSLLDGPDILPATDSDVVQEWDKYLYEDYTARARSIEVTQEEIEPYSIVQSYADLQLNNYDNYFTPNSGSPIDQYILPKRPFRLLMGFGSEVLPQFIGLSEKMPSISKAERIAGFHLIDFLTFIFEREISDTTMLLNINTGEALEHIFQDIGMLPGQYELDETSFNRINFFFVEKGEKAGNVIRRLMEAEQGRLYMDELGVIRFLNRQNYSTTPVYSFDSSNIIDYSVSEEDSIINFVRIKCDILEEFQDTSLWSSSEAIYVRAGTMVQVWADFSDPATVVDTPVYSATEIEGSYFSGSTDAEGSTPYAGIVLNSFSVFAKAAVMTFENTGTSGGAYISKIDLWGNAVRVADTIIVEDSDQDSIDKFDERRYELETNYIQKESSAISKAALILEDYKDYSSILELDVKGNMALQIGDLVAVDVDSFQSNYVITKISQVMQDGQYSQTLTVKEKEPRKIFILSSDTEARSLLDGTDVLA